MRSFFKHTLSVLAALFLFTFISFSFAYGVLTYKVNKILHPTETTLKDNTILHLKLKGQLVEHVSEVPTTERVISLSEVKEVLQYAAEDPKIQGLFIEIEHIIAPLGRIDSLHQAIQEFKQKSEKPVAVYAEGYYDVTLALASAADYIVLHPEGNIMLSGFSSKSLYFKDLFERLNVQVLMYRAGKNKAVSHPYTSAGMKEEDKEQYTHIFKVKHRTLLQKIGSRPAVSSKHLQHILAHDPYISAQKALSNYHLIDCVGMIDNEVHAFFNAHLDENYTAIYPSRTPATKETNTPPKETQEAGNTKEGTQEGEEEKVPAAQEATPQEERAVPAKYLEEGKPHYIPYQDYRQHVARSNKGGFFSSEKNKIAILPLEGPIISGEDKRSQITDKDAIKDLKKLADDDSVKAIVIVINSGGGSAMATYNIGYQIARITQKKPVICYVRDAAFSGAYWIACACDKIISSKEGAVGSIGVWTMFFNFAEAADKNFSIHADGFKTHPHSDFMKDSFHSHSEKEKELIRQSVQRTNKAFIQHVATNRNMTDEEVSRIAGGKIWCAEDSLSYKMIDGIATLEQTIKLAALMAGIDTTKEPITVHYPPKKINVRRYISYLLKKVTNPNISDVFQTQPNKHKNLTPPSLNHYQQAEK